MDLLLGQYEIKLKTRVEYTGQFVTDVINLPTSDTYLYIADFNNTLKHRYQIYVQNIFDILNVQGSVTIPPFMKDGRIHLKTEA